MNAAEKYLELISSKPSKFVLGRSIGIVGCGAHADISPKKPTKITVVLVFICI